MTEAALQNRNILIHSTGPRSKDFRARQAAAIEATYEAQAKLAALADTPDRVAANADLRRGLEVYFAVLNRSSEAALNNDPVAGNTIAQAEAAPLRVKLRDQATQRINLEHHDHAVVLGRRRAAGRPGQCRPDRNLRDRPSGERHGRCDGPSRERRPDGHRRRHRPQG
ncbi:hypothetical protein EMGR_008560 [Emarellia grisea]